MSTLRNALGVLAVCALSPLATAAVVYNEATNGDLSNNGLSPTFVSMAAGSNQVLGSIGNPGTGIDRDYFRFVVPAGQQLVSLSLLPGTTVLANVAFIGVQAGPQMLVSPISGSPAGLLGWAHYSVADIGTNILPRIGTGFGASGFTGALAAGDYTFWVQETGAGTAGYGLDFTLAAVPEPASALLMLAGALGLSALSGLHRRRAS